MTAVATTPTSTHIETKQMFSRMLSKRISSLGSKSKLRRVSIDDETLSSSIPNLGSSGYQQYNLKSAMRHTDTSDSDEKKSVTFVQVLIREHARDVDINPSVSCGPALGLGWAYNDHGAYDFDHFEETKPSRRSRSEFQMPRSVRQKLLEDHGVDPKDICTAMRLGDAVRRQRAVTMAAQEVEDITLAVEWMQRKMKRVLKLRKSYEREEQQLWVDAQNWRATSQGESAVTVLKIVHGDDDEFKV